MFTDPIIEDARRRFTTETQASWEDTIRYAYIREARLADGLVVRLGEGEPSPLTEDEVMQADPYCLAVWYAEDGSLSKDWGAQPTVKQGFVTEDHASRRSPEADAARYVRMIETLHETRRACRKCGSKRRWRQSDAGIACFDCSLRCMVRRGFVVPSE